MLNGDQRSRSHHAGAGNLGGLLSMIGEMVGGATGRHDGMTMEVMRMGPNGPEALSLDDMPPELKAILGGMGLPGFDRPRGESRGETHRSPGGRPDIRTRLLDAIEARQPLVERLGMYGTVAGGELARYLKDTEGKHDFAMLMHLARNLNVARERDSERFTHLEQRLAGFKFELPKLVEALSAFVSERTPNNARAALAHLGRVVPLCVAVMDEIAAELKEQRAKASMI